MTDNQRITLMADYWPRACRAQGWKASDRELRLKVLGEALGHRIESASHINNTTDFDKVKAHLGMLSNNMAATIETDHEDMGWARRLRKTIAEQLKCLGIYLTENGGDESSAEAYLASIIRDKFKHGSRSEPLTIDDLSAEQIHKMRNGRVWNSPSQLDQVIMALARAIQIRRKAAGDSLHDMKTRAHVPCVCKICSMPISILAPVVPKVEEPVTAENPF